MSSIFERLMLLFRSEFQFHRPTEHSMSQEEWEAFRELEEELKRAKQNKNSQAYTDHDGPTQQQLKPEVIRAYEYLKIPVGSPWSVVQKAYKILIVKNHPDRFANDPQRYKKATEKTQEINQAYQKLKQYLNQ